MSRPSPLLWIPVILGLLAPPAAAAVDPLRPASSGGIAVVERSLARLDQHRRLMIVGAHPDDEDTTLLALVTLAQGGEAAYLSLTRGEGGQNLIGDELGEALGVLRTEELLAARRLDGARQLFTSAYDFGYTPSVEETFRRWPRELLLVEVVRAIRRFRPQVLVAVFPPDERAGHGQHQASAMLAEEAFRLAGDVAAFPQLDAEGLPPWKPEVLYREAWFDPEAATLELPSAVVDPLTGHTVFQLAMAGRSQHRSQSMGVLQGLEGRPVRLTWIEGGVTAGDVEGADATGADGAAAGSPDGVTPLQPGPPAGTGGMSPPQGVPATPGTPPASPPPGVGVPAAGLPPDRAGAGAAQAAPGVGTAPAPVAPAAEPVPELFPGVDTRLAALAELLPQGADRDSLAARLERVESLVEQARQGLAPRDLGAVVPLLADAQRELSCGLTDVATSLSATTGAGRHLDRLLTEKLEVVEEGLLAAAGIAVDATVPRGDLVAGADLVTTVSLRNGGRFPAGLGRVELQSPAGWWQQTYTGPKASTLGIYPVQPLAPGGFVKHERTVAIDPAARPTVPYFLATQRAGDVYDLTGVPPDLHGEPFGPPPVQLWLELEIYDGGEACAATARSGEPGAADAADAADAAETGMAARVPITRCDDPCGVRLRFAREVVALSRDLETGEEREPLRLLPAIEVAMEPQVLVWPLADARRRELRVELAAHGAPRSGRLEVGVPEGWPQIPPQPFALEAGERRAITVALPSPVTLDAGRYAFAAAAIEDIEPPPDAAPPVEDSALAADEPIPVPAIEEDPTVSGDATAETAPVSLDATYEHSLPQVVYEHVRPQPVPRLARTTVAAFPLALPPLGTVGYVRGAADEVPEALSEVGVPIHLLDPAALESRDLGGFDAIVIGSRAYDASPELAAANPVLVDYVRRGGLLIVQFQRNEYFTQALAPVQMTMERRGAGRTTDETAPVRLLVPGHRVFVAPNEIGPTDWEGWVQERGLYYPQTWGDAALPLLAMADPGAEELEGSLLVARHGAGTYVYTGLAFFRQLPAGVPGAYRLFANLLGLAEPRVESEDLPLEELGGSVPVEP
jgi:LmbE family N-acetylglucosaminyl deacetylase